MVAPLFADEVEEFDLGEFADDFEGPAFRRYMRELERAQIETAGIDPFRSTVDEIVAPEERGHLMLIVDALVLMRLAAGRQPRALRGRILSPFDESANRSVLSQREIRDSVTENIVNPARSRVVETLRRAQLRDLGPRATRRALAADVGLTLGDLLAVDSYRELLRQGSAQALRRALRDRRFDRTVRRASREKRPIAPQRIDRMVTRYRDRLRTHRARQVTRLTTLQAAQAGVSDFWDQQLEEGRVNEVRRVWVTRGDDRVRSSHAAMNGQSQPAGQAFRSGFGNLLRFPGDPSAPFDDTFGCRCTLQVVAT